MSTLSTILLDFDGTIIDSTPRHAASIHRAFADLLPDMHVDLNESRTYVGLDHNETVAAMLAQRGIDDDALTQAIVRRAVEHYATLHNSVPCVAGVEHFIKTAHANGLRIGIVSGSPRKIIVDTLTTLELNPYIQLVVGREDVTAYKPHPAPYIHAMKTLSSTHENTIAFEDSPAGVESAWLASIPTVGILTSFDAEDLHKTVMTIPHFEQFSIAHLYELFGRNAE